MVRRWRAIAGGTAAAVLVGGAAWGVGETDGRSNGYDEGYGDGTSDGNKACLDALQLRTIQEIPLTKQQAKDITTLAFSPVAPYADGKELEQMGYTPLTTALRTGSRVVQFVVRFDSHNPPPDTAATHDLLRDANNLGSAIMLRLTDGDDVIGTASAVPGPQAYPEAPMTVVIAQQYC
jgi:hypothetical protein